MKIWTAHLRRGTAPVLVREGFSFGAFLFGPFWLLAHQAWIAGILTLCADFALAMLVRGVAQAILGLAFAVLLGLSGRDLQRWSLERRGFLHAHVIAAASEDDAMARLLDRQPDQIGPVIA